MIRTRIAPSPTGQDVHVGSISTGLMNYAWAKKNGGKFIVRIEDTDRTRIVEGGEKRMLETLETIGLHADESPLAGGPHAPYRQSERLPVYKKHAEELVAKGKAYYCTCTPERLDAMRKEQQAKKQIPKYDRFCLSRQEEVKKEIAAGKKYVVRLLMPEKEIVFNDLIRGEIKMNGANMDDQVLLKSDGFPTYHLGVVVDDHLMEISHVIRGEEWLPSTPKHVVLYEAFGWELPAYAHVSLLRNPDKSKLSKRKNPVWTSEYLAKGILPEALLNYLAQMGWSYPDGRDIFTLDEYVKAFDLKDVQTTAPVFDPVKLEWMNGEYIRRMSDEKLKETILAFYAGSFDGAVIAKTVPLVKERLKKLSDYDFLAGFFFKRPEVYDIDLAKYKGMLKKVADRLSGMANFTAAEIGVSMGDLAKELGLKNSEYFQVLRVTITGHKVSPPLNESMEILGKEEAVARIKALL